MNGYNERKAPLVLSKRAAREKIMSKQDQSGLLVLAMIGTGVLLLQNPRCNRGCKTIAQHLIEHGIQDFLGVLFA